jgi:hypothetical protein
MYPHRIRLRGPWECEPVARLEAPAGTTANLPASCRMTMPRRLRDGGLPGFAGQVRLRRRFGYPGRIDADERVWLTLSGLSDRAEVALNGQPLGTVAERDCPWETDITALLGPRNELVMLLDTDNDAGGLWGEVALEIRRTAFLRNVQARLREAPDAGQLALTGEVVGSSDRPLDLYAMVGEKTIAYTTVQPAAKGSRFELVAPDRETGWPNLLPLSLGATVRLDLIDGGVIWYTTETPIC